MLVSSGVKQSATWLTIHAFIYSRDWGCWAWDMLIDELISDGLVTSLVRILPKLRTITLSLTHHLLALKSWLVRVPRSLKFEFDHTDIESFTEKTPGNRSNKFLKPFTYQRSYSPGSWILKFSKKNLHNLDQPQTKILQTFLSPKTWKLICTSV